MIFYCIPAHNEEKTVGVVLWKLRHVMAEFPRDYQILVADDASSDRSAEVLEPYRRVLPLILMRNRERRGYAATLEMLLRESVRLSRYPRRDVIVVLQADFTDDPDNAAALLRRIESGADIAAGGPVTDATRRRFVERLARGYARRLLRRFDWPEHADPLNGLTAYRLTCVKRALAECDGNRLLPWDGIAANAALLRATMPHARRIDAVEIVHHPERAQRARRFRPLDMIGQVRQFASGNPPASAAPPAELAPDEVRGDLSVLQGPAANGGSRQDRSEGRPARSRNGPARGRKDGRASGGRRETADTRDAPDRSEKRPPRKKSRKPPVDQAAPVSTDEDGSQGDQTSGESSPSPRPRRRRGGSRSRRRKQATRVDSVSAQEDASGAPQTGEPVAQPSEGAASGTGESPEVVAGVEDGARKPSRRRRGRRGGRGRRGASGRSGTNDAPEESGGEVPNSQAEENG